MNKNFTDEAAVIITGNAEALRIESNATMRYVWRKTPGELPIRVLQERIAVREGAKFWTEWRDVPVVEE